MGLSAHLHRFGRVLLEVAHVAEWGTHLRETGPGSLGALSAVPREANVEELLLERPGLPSLGGLRPLR